MESNATICKCAENNKQMFSCTCEQTSIDPSSYGSYHTSHVISNNTRTTSTRHCKMKIQFYYTNKLISSMYSVLLFLLCSSVVYSNSTLNVIIEDQVAQVGHYFHYNILSNHSIIEVEVKVSEAGSDKLPNWLLFDKLLATFSGVPLIADEGNIFIEVQLLDDEDQVVLDEVFSIDVRPAGSVLFSRKLSKSFLQGIETSRTGAQSIITQQTQESSTKLSKQSLYFLPIHCTTKSNIVTGNLLLKLKCLLTPKQSVDLFVLLSDSLGVGIDKLYLSDKEYSKFDSKVVLWGRHSVSHTGAASNQTFTLISFIIGCNKDVMYSDIYRAIIQRLDELLGSVDKTELLERWFISVEGDDISEAKRLHERRRRQAAVLLTEIPEPNFDIVFTTAVTDILTTSIIVPTTSVVTTPSSIAMITDLLTMETILTATPSFVVSSAVMIVDSTSVIPIPSITVIEVSSTIPPLITPSAFMTSPLSKPTSVAPILTSFSVSSFLTSVITSDSFPVITPSAVFTTIVDDESSIPSLFVTTPLFTSLFITDVIFTPSFVTSSESLTPMSPSETSQPAVITVTTMLVNTPLATETSLLFSPPFITAVVDTSSIPQFTVPSITETILSSPVVVFPSSTFLETSIEIPPLTTIIAPDTSSSIQPSPFITSIPVFTDTVLTTAVTVIPTSPVLSASVFTTQLPDTSLVATATPLMTSVLITSLLQPSATVETASIVTTVVTTLELPTTSIVLTETSVVPVFTTDILTISSSDVVPPSATNVILPTSTMLDTFIMSRFISPSPNVTNVLLTSIATTPTPVVTSVEVTDFTVVEPSSSVSALITTVVFSPVPSVIDTSKPIEISSTPVEVTTTLFTPTPFVSTPIIDTSRAIETSSAPADVTTVVFSPSPSFIFDTSQPIEISSTPVEVTTAMFTQTSSVIIDTSEPIETSSMPVQITSIIFSPTPFVSSAVVDSSEPLEPTTTLPVVTVPSITTDTLVTTSFIVILSSPTPVVTIVSSVAPPVATSEVVSFITPIPSEFPVETTIFVPTTTLAVFTVPSVTSVVLPETSSLVFSSVIIPTRSEVFDASTLIPSSVPSTPTAVIASTSVSAIQTMLTTMLSDSSEITIPTTTVPVLTPSLVVSDVINTTTVIGDTSVTEVISPTPTLTSAVVILTTSVVNVSSSVMAVPTTTGPVFSVFTSIMTSAPVFTITATSPSVTSMDVFTTLISETSQVLPTTTVVLPTTTAVPVTTMVTTMAPTPTPTITNQPPQLINPIDPLIWNEGQPATYEIPENTFYDTENGSTSNLALTLQHSTGQTVTNTTWVQLIDGVLYGLPLQEQIDNLATTEHVFILVAQDPQNAIARDFIVISVLPQDPFVANFITFFVDGDFGIFDQQITSKIDLANRLASFGPNTDVYVRDIFDGSVGIQYANITIPNSDCETFNNLVGSIYSNITLTYSNSFVTTLLPYNVTKVPIIEGPCLQPVGPNVSDVSTIEERSSNNFYYTIIPAVVIAALLLVGAILACVLYRRTHRERKKIYRENLDVTFINRRAIILEAEDRKRPKRSHRPTIMHGELSQDVVTRREHDEADGGDIIIIRPPAHEKEPLIPECDPPAYQLAPIFDNYAIRHEDSQD